MIDGGGYTSLMEQMAVPGIFPADVAVVQAVTDRSRMTVVRDGILAAVRRAVREGVTLYVHVDDQETRGGEGAVRSDLHMFLFLLALMRMLDADLGRLSVIRRKAA
jgi:hypothetical protein